MTVYPKEPTRNCDILMKGGITSGVIYPLAVCKLATQYGLRSVGGSSAGAIAAAAAAAAESNPSRQDGFTRLEALPDDITAKTSRRYGGAGATLPAPTVDGPAVQSVHRRAGSVRDVPDVGDGVGCVTGFYRSALIGAIPGAVLLVLGIAGGGLPRWAAIIAAVVVLLAGAAAGSWSVFCAALRFGCRRTGSGCAAACRAPLRRDPRH